MIPFRLEGIEIPLDEVRREIEEITEWSDHRKITAERGHEIPLDSYTLFGYSDRPTDLETRRLSPGPTSAWKNFPTLRFVSEQIPGSTDLLRVTRLGYGRIPRFREWLGTPNKDISVRFVVPVFTPEASAMRVYDHSGKYYDVATQDGTAWYIHTIWPHETYNLSMVMKRVSIIIDKRFNPAMRRFITSLMP